MRSPEEAAPAIEELAREVRAAVHRERVRGGAPQDEAGGVTAAHRGVMESLFRGGPQTVPAMARARPVSRQHIQILVNRLVDLGLVAAVANPAHMRSPLFELTPAGSKRFAEMQRRERRTL